jgi:hypothetical protein
MSKKTRKVRKGKGDTKDAAPAETKEVATITPVPAAVEAPKMPKAPKAPKPVATGVRAEAARRTAAGKFTKDAFHQIGGQECPSYAKLTWVQRDAIHEKFPDVKSRYLAHLASVASVK